MKEFYVYIYFDPRKSGKYKYGKYTFGYEPFYVGRGGKTRDTDFAQHSKICS